MKNKSDRLVVFRELYDSNYGCNEVDIHEAAEFAHKKLEQGRREVKKSLWTSVAMGFFLGMMALVMLAFKISTNSMRTYRSELKNERFRLIEKAEKTMKHDVENLITYPDGKMIINYNPELSDRIRDWMME